MFTAILVKLKQDGMGAVQHKDQLTAADFEKLYFSHQLDISSPDGLLNKVFVDIMIYLCNCGREKIYVKCVAAIFMC